MAVQEGPSFKRYAANGIATAYSIPFLLLSADDLVVTLDGVTVTSGITLTGIGDPTSTATFDVAPSGDLLFLLVIPFQRLADYQLNGDFLASTVNNDLDRIWLALKELRRDDQRALSVDPLEPEGIPPLPVAALRLSRVLAFDADGEPVPSNLTLQQIEEQPALALASAAEAQASATAASSSAGDAESSANASSAAALLASKWATDPEDTEVTPGFFSALHWAAKALASATAAATTLANSVLKTGAQTMAGPLSVTGGIATIPFNKEYVSPEQAITAAGSLTLAHGLGAVPKNLRYFLVCKTSEGGYSIGDVIDWGTIQYAPSASAINCGFVNTPDSTNINIRFGSTANTFYLLNKTTGSAFAATNANWRLVVRAMA